MAYADYTFYTTTYFGNTIPEASFSKYSDIATDELDAITLGGIGTISSLSANMQKRVKKAMCAIADNAYAIDNYLQRANSTSADNVKSLSSGSESISYGTSSTAITKAAENDSARKKLYYESAKTYLSATGLLYAGC